MKRVLLFLIAVGLIVSLTGCFGGKCAHCDEPLSRDDRLYDPIAGKYVCWDCYFDNAGDIVDQLIYSDYFYDNADDILDYLMDTDMIEEYLNAHGYLIVKK